MRPYSALCLLEYQYNCRNILSNELQFLGWDRPLFEDYPFQEPRVLHPL
jgi:hypothetical protein